MAYNERIKNFGRIREYMREFYVYGFKSRSEYTSKSARSYDDEKRRMESLLGDYMRFRRQADGKNVFLSVDSRVVRHNPLYRAWKAKSFTDGDITLHFILLDLLSSTKTGMTSAEIADGVCAALPDANTAFDESTVRKKLKEYTEEGIVLSEKSGKTVRYRLAKQTDMTPYADILDFFSEVAPCGVIGSYLLDKTKKHEDCFAFKHHYITSALDSGIVCSLFEGMGEKKSVTIETPGKRGGITAHSVVPLRLMIGVQSGRQYLMAYIPENKRISSFRVDRILSVKIGKTCDRFDEYRAKLDGIGDRLWGVSAQSFFGNRTEHVGFTVVYGDNETFIHERLEREKRCGTVERIDKNTSRFSADVYDATELIPWIRTFIGRIVDVCFSDRRLQERFLGDIRDMYELYGTGEEK